MPDNSITIPYASPGRAFGEGVADNIKGVANAAGDAVCGLYRDYPGFMTGSMFGSPLAAASDGMFNSLCSPRGLLPDAPTPNPPGGQCVCQLYTVTFFFQPAEGGPPLVSTRVLPGPIGSVIKVNTTAGGGAPAADFGFAVGSAACGGRSNFNIAGGANRAASAGISSIVPADGGPDLCGNLAPSYPITQPPDNAINFNVPVTFSPNFTVNTPVTIFPPVLNLSPSFRFGDLNIDLNLGGLTISPAINIGGGQNPPGVPTQPTPQPGNEQSDRNYDEILSRLLRLANRARLCQDCDDDYDFLQSGLTGGRSGRIFLPPGSSMVAAALLIVTEPTNPKKETGSGQNDVYYAGWGWFESNGNYDTRQPIDSQGKIFYPNLNPSPNSFVFTMRTGYSAQALITYKRRKVPLPPP